MSARIALATLNAKYIHASLGLRYLMANMPLYGGADLTAVTQLHEFTIHRAPQAIVDELLASLGDADVRIVGFGVYIWNVVQTEEVIRLLKRQCPQIQVVLGGPEVSFELEQQAIVQASDYVITGWGDVSFPKLCKALVHGPRPLMKVIAGEQPPLSELTLPYAHYSATDLAQRVLYVEASRGCPFKCAFCLSALDKTAWAFALEPFLLELQSLLARGARSFKFVDRTFNLKVDVSVRILQFFLDALQAMPHERLFLHFELVPDHLPDALKDMLVRFPAGTLQFEIGIQSFNPEVQKAISRRQDNPRTEDNIRWLLTHTQAHLHTDLIFGLPGESWHSFAQGFDRLYALGPHEIQLGLLKRLRGTPLAQRSPAGGPAQEGMVYDPLPPYTVQHTGAVSAAEAQAFARLARYWDLLANSGRFGKSCGLLLQAGSAFAALSDFSAWLWQRTGSTHALTPEDLVDALFDYLTQVRALPADAVRAALLADYVGSGARSNPSALQGLLPRREKQNAHNRPAAQRQQRHQASRSKIDL
ncbi:DUF4080 domain-containing protein [Rhodoferax sp. GW822-FHT02A01]|uniref:B12-binding domain-containing radical SAM protein n=1 Tax=Rhodoferax sp. GW822-FHT02A01 TaxID=3141537 RepID=UPI00315D3B6A